MPQTVEPKARLFRGFADPSRLLIVEALRGGERTVSEICRATGLTQPNASNHLACLLGCKIVERDRRGRFVYYRLADERIEALLSIGDDVARGAGDGECCPVCGSGSSW